MRKRIYYKYFPIERVSYFKDGLLRFTQPKFLNDSFECLPVFSSCIELYSRMTGIAYTENSYNPVTIANVKGEYLLDKYLDQKKNESNGFGIFSLSKRYDSNLMWGHYAKHSGFAIGFDIEHDFFKSENFLLGKVKYSNERPTFDELELDDNVYFTKSKDWSYEKEFRIIASLSLSDKISENIYLYKVPFEAISELILGLNIDYENFLEINQFASKHKIPLYRCKQSNKMFSIEKQLIV